MYWSLFPVWFIDTFGCLTMIALSVLCLGVAREIIRRDPDSALSTYLFWFCIAIFAFSLSRSLGHLIKHVLHFAGLGPWWQHLAPISGSINTLTFVVIGAVTLFFNRMEVIIQRMTEDKEKIEKMSCELLNLNREMESIVSERAMAEMALRIAHEVRNPVTIIGGLLHRLQKEFARENRGQEKLEMVLSQTSKLEKLVADFEHLVGERRKHFAAVNVGMLVEQARELVQPDATQKGIAIIFNPKINQFTIQADEQLFKVAIVHLLRNAVEACDSGATIAITLKVSDSCFELIIQDTGRGIPQDVLSHIFEPFYVSGEIKTGLGFPYVRQIIEEHKGRISIESEEGKGTKVTIRIPALLGELS